MDSTEIFEVYAPEDELLKLELDKHLSYLRRSMVVETWHSQQVLPDANWSPIIDAHMESASIILILISEHFLNSSYSDGSEMKRAIERHDLGEVRVVPILLRPVNWPAEPFQHLQVLPSNGIPVTQWKEQDEAFLSIAKGIQSAITEINLSSLAKKAQSHPEESVQQTESIVSRRWLAEVLESKNEGIVPSEFGVKEIAEWLKLRKRKNHRTVLLLGARAGSLFRSNRFYKTLALFSPLSFSPLTRIESFNECFYLLNSGRLDTSSIDALLRYCLGDSAPSKADLALAELIKQGYFDEIVTTNIDDGLERALLEVGMRESNEFKVVVPRLGSNMISYEKKLSFRIVKVRGDLASKEYRIGKSFYLDADDESNAELRSFLQHVLARDVLAIGIDPGWDESLFPFLSRGRGAIWFVDEENRGSLLSALLEKRDVRTIIGLEGSYDNFLMKLYRYFPKVDSSIETPISSEYTRDLAERLQSMSKQIQAMSENSVSDVSTVDLALVSKQLRDIQDEIDELEDAVLNLSKLQVQVEQEVSE